MKKNYIFKTLIATLFFSSQLFSQVNVTIKVDMSGQSISEQGIHVVGSINEWNTMATPLTKEGETNIYSAIIPLNTGWHEYKFLNGDAWGTEENPGYPCAPSNGNRFLYINDSGNDVELEAVPFNGCNAENTGFSFTLNVDMSSTTVSSNGVKIAGWLNGWNGDNLLAPDIKGNIHSATLRLPTPSDYPIKLEYKYVNGSDWETPSADCGTVIESNRVETLSNSGQSLFNVFNGCNYTLNLVDNFTKSIKIRAQKDLGLVITSTKNYTNLNIELYNILGKKVQSNTISSLGNSKNIIPLKKLNTGIYIIKINDSQSVFTKKILIK